MKKTYAIPSVVLAGNVMRETNATGGPDQEVPDKQPLTAGSLGFNL